MFPVTLVVVTAVLCFLLPILTILYFRLYRHASLIALVAFYGLMLVRYADGNSLEPALENPAGTLFHCIEYPLLLAALLFFSPAKTQKQNIHWLIFLFLGYETVVTALFGFTPLTNWYLVVPGSALVLCASLFLFLRQWRFTLLHRKNGGLLLMLGALVFSSGCQLLFWYAWFRTETTPPSTVYALPFLSAGLSALLMSAGLYRMRYRIRELQEIKIARRELQLLFAS